MPVPRRVGASKTSRSVGPAFRKREPQPVRPRIGGDEPTEPAARRNPFPDDPTWHTGPRPVVQAPPASLPPAAQQPPPQAAATATQRIHKCVTARGSVSYSSSGSCAGGQASTIDVVLEPRAASPVQQQRQQQPAAPPPPRTAAADDFERRWQAALGC